MKIVAADNLARETVAERLVAENIGLQDEAVVMVEALRNDPQRDNSVWYKITKDDYVLWRGMEEFL